jgi:hypothetical protein
MVFIKQLILGTVAMVSLAGTANAAFVPATWTDHRGGTTSVGAGETYWYQHNIADAGSGSFTPFQDLVEKFTLTVNVYDDSSDLRGILGGEVAELTIHGYIADIFGDLSGQEVYESDWTDFTLSNGWTFTGLFELNTAGRLTVGIKSWFGDFIVGDSTLVAEGYTHQVPEPGTIALLGLGLLGVGFARRKKLVN